MKQTRDKGMILDPDKVLLLDLFVDADFAGLWSDEDAEDEDSVKSRTGYVLTLGGMPVYWQSKIQEICAMSTMESEYIAAATGMKVLMPILVGKYAK